MLPAATIEKILKKYKFDIKPADLKAAQLKADKLKKDFEEVLYADGLVDEQNLYEKAADFFWCSFYQFKRQGN